MTQHLHHLRGCAPAPLALYLKAFGILRLIAERPDPDARGWWCVPIVDAKTIKDV